MALVEGTNRPDRGRLPVVAALVVTALMAPVAGASATSSGRSSESPCTQTNCVFVLEKGRFKTSVSPGEPLDSLVGINNRGQIAGGYVEDDGESAHGYVRDRRGRFTTIDVPRAAWTLSYDLNDRRQIVGIYGNPDAPPDDQPSPMQMPMMMLATDGRRAAPDVPAQGRRSAWLG
jgi:hypothetical protein